MKKMLSKNRIYENICNKNFFRKIFITFLVCCYYFPITTKANAITTLDKKENIIKQYIIEHRKEQLFLLEKLVNVNSGTMNFAGINQVKEIVRPHFDSLGFKTYWVPEPANLHRAGTFIAKNPSGKGKKILLIGHLDTVFPKNSHFQKFYREGNKIKGPGVIDDKGGDVVILYALKALQAAQVLDKINVSVVLTGDEENSGKPTAISRKPLFAEAKGSEVALGFEWAFTSDTATIARRGVSGWKIRTQGQGLHSSEIFKKNAGNGAIFEIARILNSMRTKLENEKGLSFNPGVILGGSRVEYDENNSKGTAFGKINVIAKQAVTKGDLRFLTEEQKIKAEETIKTIVNDVLPETNANIQFQDAIPSMEAKEASKKLLQAYSKVSEDLGYSAVTALDPAERGAADISHVSSLVKCSLDGLGPVGVGAHSEQETLDIQSLVMQTQRAAILIYRLSQQEMS